MTLRLTPHSQQDGRGGQAGSSAVVSARTADDTQVHGRLLLAGARSAVRSGGHRALARMPSGVALHASTKEPPQEDVHQDATGNS